MKRVLQGGFLLVALVCMSSAASAQTPSPPASDLTGRGTVSGDLVEGGSLSVDLRVAHTQGWQHIQEIEVDLELHGSVLDRLQFFPTQSSVVVGDGAPASLGQSARLRGSYFQVDPSKVSLSARGERLAVTIPIRLVNAPPPGARMTLSASAIPLATLGPDPLTEPVESSSGFSWGTLAAAAIAALLLGGFFGNVMGVRRRPPARVSVYGAVQRRLSDEKAKR